MHPVRIAILHHRNKEEIGAVKFKAATFVGVAPIVVVPLTVVKTLEATSKKSLCLLNRLGPTALPVAPVLQGTRQSQSHLRRLQKEAKSTITSSKKMITHYPAIPVVPAAKLEEEGSEFCDDDYKPPFVGAQGGEQLEEEELSRALKASLDATLEKQAPREERYT